MATKNIETVSGLVEQVNAKQKGVKVAGEWLNISQYHALAELPLFRPFDAGPDKRRGRGQ